ncbi:hypothetical protein RvY_05627 [Ramazzottius varieornatus]|uniref:Uncharacterized protein n=1 Tax=Ramazzottius varieornatus TaxID=947166 RepID=A0A1D1UZA7_RAMVA|nr:hypothetical protein RvY_05627 [Ramazzottius varieornatus]
MAVSDDKWIGFFEKDAQRKYALKEAELKNAYDLEAKKLDFRAKELELESRRLDIEAKRLHIPLDEFNHLI